jgi:uncharacterized small protein (DUF1192 family)
MSDLEVSMMKRVGELNKEVARLKAEVERLKEGNECLDQMHEKEMARSAFLCEQVERLTKAVMHSPAAQLKLKELEGKTTFEEINPKDDNSNITTELLVLCNRQASDIRRLTKAGDKMAHIHRFLGFPSYTSEWESAKEGKAQP